MFKKSISYIALVAFVASSVFVPGQAKAQPPVLRTDRSGGGLLGLPEPGKMVFLSAPYKPTIIKGLTVNKNNPFQFDFIVDVGQDKLQGAALRNEGDKLIKYFLASLAIPEKDLWVNLSPYEKEKTVPEALGQTDMGRDLLAQDYILKQITASLIYPEKELGKKFWDKVYSQIQAKYGTSAQVASLPVNTFNKVWIVADKAEVFERGQTAFVTKSHLKVMLEEDYLAKEKGDGYLFSNGNVENKSKKVTVTFLQDIIRDIILPEIENEVNVGKNFANLRQIMNSLILASWYKKNLKQALLNQAYADKSTVKGIDLEDKTIKKQIYNQYLQAYKKGVFNFIKEDPDTTPRKYFSGGWVVGKEAANPSMTTDTKDFAQSIKDSTRLMRIQSGVNINGSSAVASVSTKADLISFIINSNLFFRSRYSSYVADDKSFLVAYSKEQDEAIRPLVNAVVENHPEEDFGLEYISAQNGWTVIVVNQKKFQRFKNLLIVNNGRNEFKFFRTAMDVASEMERMRSHEISPESIESFLRGMHKDLIDSLIKSGNGLPQNYLYGNSDERVMKIIDGFEEQAIALFILKQMPKRQNFHSSYLPAWGVNIVDVRLVRRLDGPVYKGVVIAKSAQENMLNFLNQRFLFLNKAMTTQDRERQERKDKGAIERWGHPSVTNEAIEQLVNRAKTYNLSSFVGIVNETEILLRGNDNRIDSLDLWRLFGYLAWERRDQDAKEILAALQRQAGIDPAQATAKEDYGGIDLKRATEDLITSKDANAGGVQMNVDPAMIERIKREGIQSLTPVIYSITPIANIWQIIRP